MLEDRLLYYVDSLTMNHTDWLFLCVENFIFIDNNMFFLSHYDDFCLNKIRIRPCQILIEFISIHLVRR